MRRVRQILVAFAALGISGVGGWIALDAWRLSQVAPAEDTNTPGLRASASEIQPVRLTPQAQRNLELVTKPLKQTTFWRKVDVPGVIVDRPGISDRGVVAPVSGIITQIYHYPGDMVKPNSPLFALRLVSESLHASQLELFKATREIEIAENQRQRFTKLAQSGALAGSRIIETDNQIDRMQATVEAYQQDLEARGLPTDSIAAAARGKFLTELTVTAPGAQALRAAEIVLASAVKSEPAPLPFAFELHELKVELGQQVEAGELLCNLADHRALLIEGRGFKEDLPLIQAAAKNGWEIDVEYEIEPGGDWPPLPAKLRIHHVANTIDVESRTFAFFLALENQWQAYTQDGQTRLLWRFRPGDRVHLHVAVEKFDNVFVLPQQAIVRQGPDAFAFRHNGEFFDRRPVHVVYEDRLHVVLANDGSLREGFFYAQNAAASINRVMKAQAASGAPANVHVHPDGTVHAAH